MWRSTRAANKLRLDAIPVQPERDGTRPEVERNPIRLPVREITAAVKRRPWIPVREEVAAKTVAKKQPNTCPEVEGEQ